MNLSRSSVPRARSRITAILASSSAVLLITAIEFLCAVAQKSPHAACGRFPRGTSSAVRTLEEATARETFEETGVVFDPDRLDLYNVINMTDVEQVCILFRMGFSKAPTLRAGSECLEVAFMSEDQIATLDLAWQPSLGTEIRHYFQQLRLGDFAIRLVRLASAAGATYSCRSYPLRSASSGSGPR